MWARSARRRHRSISTASGSDHAPARKSPMPSRTSARALRREVMISASNSSRRGRAAGRRASSPADRTAVARGSEPHRPGRARRRRPGRRPGRCEPPDGSSAPCGTARSCAPGRWRARGTWSRLGCASAGRRPAAARCPLSARPWGRPTRWPRAGDLRPSGVLGGRHRRLASPGGPSWRRDADRRVGPARLAELGGRGQPRMGVEVGKALLHTLHDGDRGPIRVTDPERISACDGSVGRSRCSGDEHAALKCRKRAVGAVWRGRSGGGGLVGGGGRGPGERAVDPQDARAPAQSPRRDFRVGSGDISATWARYSSAPARASVSASCAE